MKKTNLLAVAVALTLSTTAMADSTKYYGDFGMHLGRTSVERDFGVTDTINGKQVPYQYDIEYDYTVLGFTYERTGEVVKFQALTEISVGGDYEVTSKQVGVSGCSPNCGSADLDSFRIAGSVLRKVHVPNLQGDLFVGVGFDHTDIDSKEYMLKNVRFDDSNDQTGLKLIADYELQQNMMTYGLMATLGYNEIEYSTFGRDQVVNGVQESRTLTADTFQVGIEARVDYNIQPGWKIGASLGYKENFEIDSSCSRTTSVVSNVGCSVDSFDSSESTIMVYVELDPFKAFDLTQHLVPAVN